MKPILPPVCLQICLLGSPQKAAPEAEVTKEAIALTHIYFLATAVILWPAWWFGLVVPYAFIPLAWLYEKLKSGKINPSLIVI